MSGEGRRVREEAAEDRGAGAPGIVIADGRNEGRALRRAPRIQAFIWGGKVRPSPTLPYGRWKMPV